MKGFEILTAAEQVAERLREDLMRGTWVDLMPGEDRLMARLGVGRNTIREALILLEQYGYLQSQGTGKQRRITLPKNAPSPAMRVGLLLYDKQEQVANGINLLKQSLSDAGHQVSTAPKCLTDLKMDPKRVVAYAKRQDVDAWVVQSAPKAILESLLIQSTPVFSYYGCPVELPIAGVVPESLHLKMEIIQQLIDMGHKRIINISRSERIIPVYGIFQQSFLKKLQENGIPTSDYNMPIWGPDPKDLHRCLDKLFAHTPPTAMIIDEPDLFFSAQLHLAERGIISPRDVSLICGQPHTIFSWLETPVTHISWSEDRMVQCVMRWIAKTARGKKNTTQTRIGAKIIKGGTIGPPPK